MPKRQLRLPITTQSGRSIPRPALHISPAAWSRIERAYGSKIPISVRAQIKAATVKYLWLAKMERGAAPLKSAPGSVAALRKATDGLLDQLKDIQNCSGDVQSFVGHIIRQRLRLPHQQPLSDHLGGFVRDLSIFAAVLHAVDISSAAPIEQRKKRFEQIWAQDSQQDGRARVAWVRSVRTALKVSGLPAGISKLKDYPFVRLVRAIQNELPSEGRAFTIASLADAIYVAAHSN
jgi:hypothetical protein